MRAINCIWGMAIIFSRISQVELLSCVFDIPDALDALKLLSGTYQTYPKLQTLFFALFIPKHSTDQSTFCTDKRTYGDIKYERTRDLSLFLEQKTS